MSAGPPAAEEVHTLSAEKRAAGRSNRANPYPMTSWDDPYMATDLNVVIPAGQRLGWHCSYDYVAPMDPYGCEDLAEGCCYQFGPTVETSEHCNMFAYYYPKVADYSCI